ncbi:MAG: DUF6498-containing protein [Planctomycetota bacterium]|jgi:hypothetical protein
MLPESPITRFQKSFSNLPLIALLVSNTLPIFGVLFFSWDLFAIVLLYWTENIVIGFYTVLKMMFYETSNKSALAGSFPSTIPPFILHYGGFTMGHGLFLLALFNPDAIPSNLTWPCFLVFLQAFVYGMSNALSQFPPTILIGIAGLFASHGYSFGYNYFRKGERKRIDLGKLMIQPYERVVMMHIALIFGAFYVDILGSPIALLLTLIWLKTGMDVKMHLRERRKGRTPVNMSLKRRRRRVRRK